MRIPPRSRLVILLVLVAGVGLVAGVWGPRLREQYTLNRSCCALPRSAALVLSAKEVLGLVKFPSQIGQDKWVSESVFPNVTDGFFVDVGSADGEEFSNTAALERKGWRGICIDPFPTHMERRTCEMFKDVVYDGPGKPVTFHTAGPLGGVAASLQSTRSLAEGFPTVEFTSVTLDEILHRAKAPPYIHFMSLDIEGAELLALQGLNFDQYQFGAFAIEHNSEAQKRSDIQTLLARHGYRRSHSFVQDDFYLPAQVGLKKLPPAQAGLTK